jgi:enoyl-CoA hydratase/carnithine racemase
MPELRIDIRGEIAELRLEAGASAAVDAAFLAQLDDAAQALHDERDVRAALLTGDSGAFALAAAADVLAHAPLPFRSLETIRLPVVACIEGPARDAGLELALACDVRVASAGATFAAGAVADSRVPSLGATQRLPRLVGAARAADMILLGTQLDAPAALAFGLVNDVVPEGETRARGEQVARRIAERGPIAIAYAKEAILRGLDMPLEQALRYETDLTIILQATADRAEGVRAFLEKRRPEFRGE